MALNTMFLDLQDSIERITKPFNQTKTTMQNKIEWVSTKESLPKTRKEVLIVDETSRIYTGVFDPESGWTNTSYRHDDRCNGKPIFQIKFWADYNLPQ